MLPFRILLWSAAVLLAPAARAFDHSHAAFDRLLKERVRDGWVEDRKSVV